MTTGASRACRQSRGRRPPPARPPRQWREGGWPSDLLVSHGLAAQGVLAVGHCPCVHTVAVPHPAGPVSCRPPSASVTAGSRPDAVDVRRLHHGALNGASSARSITSRDDDLATSSMSPSRPRCRRLVHPGTVKAPRRQFRGRASSAPPPRAGRHATSRVRRRRGPTPAGRPGSNAPFHP